MLTVIFLVNTAVLFVECLLMGTRKDKQEIQWDWDLFAALSWCALAVISIATGLTIGRVYSYKLLTIAVFALNVAGAGWLLLVKKPVLTGAYFKSALFYKYDKLVIVGMLVCAVLYLVFPTEYFLGGRDPGLYTINAINIVNNGSMVYLSDAFINEQYSRLYDVVRTGYPGIYSEFSRGVSQLPFSTHPQFLPMFPSALAIGTNVAGMFGLYRVNGVLALLAILSIYFFTKKYFGLFPARLAFLFMALNPSQIWNARITQTELLSQWLFFMGVIYFAQAWEKNSFKLVALSSVLIGIGCFNRVDTYIIGLGILAVLIYAALFCKERLGICAVSSGVYICFVGLSLVYGFKCHYGYFSDLWNGGSFSGVIFITGFFAVVALGCIGFRLLFLRKRELKNIFIAVFHSKPGAITICGILFAAFLFAYFVRPLLNSQPIGTNAYFSANAMAEFCWYTSFIAIPLAILGLYKKLRGDLQEAQSLYFFFAASIASIVGYIINPTITPDHLWASRRWITVNIPAILLLCAFGIQQLGYILNNRVAVKKWVQVGATMCVSLYLLYQSMPFLTVSMLHGTTAQLANVAAQLGDEEVYYTRSVNLALPLRVMYGKKIYMFSCTIQEAAEKLGSFLYVGEPVEHEFEINYEPISQGVVNGLFPPRLRGQYPREAIESNYDASVGRVSYQKLNSKSIHLESDVFSQNKDETREDLYSNATPGHLVYGPYLMLPKGKYEIVFDLILESATQDAIGFVDISDSAPKSSYLQKINLEKNTFGQNKRASVRIEAKFPNGASAVETRVFTNEGTVLGVENITIHRISDEVEKVSQSKIMIENRGGELTLASVSEAIPGFYKVDLALEMQGELPQNHFVASLAVEDNKQTIFETPIMAEQFVNGKYVLNQALNIEKISGSLEMKLTVMEGGTLRVNSSTLETTENFLITPAEMLTENGRSEGDKMVSDGTPGMLLFGPYMPLASGAYEAQVELTLLSPETAPQGQVTLTANSEHGTRLLGKSSVSYDKFVDGKYILSVPFMTVNAIKGVAEEKKGLENEPSENETLESETLESETLEDTAQRGLEFQLAVEEGGVISAGPISITRYEDSIVPIHLDQFGTLIGEITGDRMVATGTDNHLLFGNYFSQEKGSYIVWMDMELAESLPPEMPVAVVDIAKKGKIISEKTVTAGEFVNAKLELFLPYSLKERTDELEYRVLVRNSAKLSVENIRYTNILFVR